MNNSNRKTFSKAVRNNTGELWRQNGSLQQSLKKINTVNGVKVKINNNTRAQFMKSSGWKNKINMSLEHTDLPFYEEKVKIFQNIRRFANKKTVVILQLTKANNLTNTMRPISYLLLCLHEMKRIFVKLRIGTIVGNLNKSSTASCK